MAKILLLVHRLPNVAAFYLLWSLLSPLVIASLSKAIAIPAKI